MVPVHVITMAAHKETAKQSILKRLREADATNAAMPASLDLDSEEAQTALADLQAAGKVREARSGLYYLDESAAKAAQPGHIFIALVATLIALSVAASVIAIAATR